MYMMFSKPLAPDTPEWLLITFVVVFLIILFGLTGWGLILEIRYTSPFTLITTSNRDKWRRAAILAFLQTAMIPILGLVAPIMSPLPDQWLEVPICSGIWIVLFPIATLYKRWEFERHIKSYQRLDKMIKDKNSIYQRLFSSPFTSWTKILFTADQKRFFSEGFPEDIEQQKNVES
ncbi:MAG: hypothetical protein WAW61_15810 [Methylococcaceae bacterium]